jgi:hypothetical protein
MTKGLRCRYKGLESRVQGSGSRVSKDLDFRMYNSGSRNPDSRVLGLRFRLGGLGFMVYGLWFRV